MKTKWNSPAVLSAMFAFIFTFCLYQNASGITMPFFTIGFVYLVRKSMIYFGRTRKKDSLFYEVSMILIGISTFLTADAKIIILNYLVLFLLSLSYMLHQYLEDEKWDVPEYVLHMVNGFFGSIGKVFAPFVDCNRAFKDKEAFKEKKNSIRYILVGIVIAIPIVVIILALLTQADAVFGNVVNHLISNISIPQNLIGITFMAVFGFFMCYCLLAYLTGEKKQQKTTKRREGESLIAITFTSIIGFIYLVFSSIQIFYLFMGFGQLPQEYNYAQYAREGFFQLVAVCIMNLILVLFCFYYYGASKALKVCLSVICGCTYVMIFSSAYRMILYIREYQLTFLRVFVLWDLLLIFLVMTGIFIAIHKESFPLLQYLLICSISWFLMFSFSHPDSYIAHYNIKATTKEAYGMDLYYVFNLSPDAAINIAKERERIRMLDEINENEKVFLENSEYYFNEITAQKEAMGIRKFNISLFIASSFDK